MVVGTEKKQINRVLEIKTVLVRFIMSLLGKKEECLTKIYSKKILFLSLLSLKPGSFKKSNMEAVSRQTKRILFFDKRVYFFRDPYVVRGIEKQFKQVSSVSLLLTWRICPEGVGCSPCLIC